MQRFRLFFICLLGLFAAGIALGQGDVTVVTDNGMGTVEKLIKMWLPWLVVAASALTAMFPSTNKFMLIIDVFAGAWGKARNDPNAQRWGG